MIRKHESSVSWKAGALAVAVHVVLLAALLISFNWKAAHNVLNATEVDLWDKLPAQTAPNPAPIVEPKPDPKPEPVVKEAPKEEEKKLEAQKLEEQQKQEEKEAEIALEKKKQELAEKERQMAEKEKQQKEKELEEKRKKDEDKKKLLADMRNDVLQEKPKKDSKKQNDALKQVQQDALNDEKGDSDKKAAAANAGEISAYKAKIQAKIRGNVNKTLCPDDNAELRFEIGLLPTGELSGTPKITKSSGNTACDDAVERAIRASEPLPLPSDPNLFSSFRNLNLKFRPND